jgi:crotonobetainyl-CoA:carnitine CoA-transferase CaiB-like acyl-CoA transferase
VTGSAVADQPLAGKRVLEVCHMLAGPYCGMLLADLGAEVIKIETGEGDIGRETGRHWVGPHNVYFASLNRNKKSVLIDLKTPDGKQAFENLVSTADALITNLRPDAIVRLGLDYETLKSINPKLACVALTGFGLTGPFRDEPAYDYIIQALCGLMMLTGEPGSPPARAGYSVVDNTGGMMAAIGALARLLSGQGGQVDVSLYDVMLSQLNYVAAAYLNSGERPTRLPSGGHAYFAPAQIFATSNGYLALFITHDRFWKIFCDAANRPEWIDNPLFATMRARSENRDCVVEHVAALLGGQTSEYWLETFRNRGLVVAGVRTLEAALDSAESQRMLISIDTPEGVLRLTGNPIRMGGAAREPRAPPLLGEHTDSRPQSATDLAPHS